jgi:hypothetical protein
MASSTSESDSSTFAGEEMQRHFSHFFSLTSDINRVSQNPLVASAEFNNRLLSIATLKEGDQQQMWEFIRI